MGYGNVAPAPVRSTDWAAATPARNAAAEKATAMLRTVLITCDSERVVIAPEALSSVSRPVTRYVKDLSRLLAGSANREEDSNGGSGTDDALSGNGSAVCFDQVLNDSKAKPGAPGLTGPAAIGAVEALEDSRQMLGRDT